MMTSATEESINGNQPVGANEPSGPLETNTTTTAPISQEQLLAILHSIIYLKVEGEDVDSSITTTITEEQLKPLLSVLCPPTTFILDMFIDMLWLLDLQTEEDTTARSRLVSLLYSLTHSHALLPVPLLLERLEPDFLEASQVISSSHAFHRRLAKINTTLYYKQSRYNLFWEEAEGFAHLVTTLQMHPVPSLDSAYSSEQLLHRIMMLIGRYDLDPYRVADIVIEMMGMRLGQALVHGQMETVRGLEEILEQVMKLLQMRSSTLAAILGLKLEYYRQRKGDVDAREFDIMRIIARLLKNKFLDLEDILPHMGYPEETHQWIIASQERIISWTPPSASRFLPGDNALDHSPPNILESIQDALGANVSSDDGGSGGAILGSESSVKGWGPVPSKKIPTNQRAQLAAALLELGEWQTVISPFLLLRWPAIVQVSPLVRSQLARTIVQLVDKGILIETDKPNQDFNGENSVDDLLLKYLPLLGPGGLAWNVSLFWYVIRRLSEMPLERMLDLFHYMLLPSLSLLPTPNPALTYALWEGGLRNISLSHRYSLYEAWQLQLQGVTTTTATSTSTSSFQYLPDQLVPIECRLARNLILNRVRRIMRRLTKENVRQYGRLLAKLAHSHPTIVLALMVDQIQAYDNLIPPVIDALKYLTPLGFDVLGWTLVRALRPGGNLTDRPRLKEDGTSVAGWLQSLATFTGALFRRYWAICDVRGLLYFLAQRLGCQDNSADNSVDAEQPPVHREQFIKFSSCELTILSELLRRMGGVEPLLNSSERRIEALAGGPGLKAEIALTEVAAGVGLEGGGRKRSANMANSTAATAAAHKLVSVLVEEKLLIPLWIALGQQRSRAVYGDDEENESIDPDNEEMFHVKVMGLMVDAGHVVLAQYIELIGRAQREGWLQLAEISLPSLTELIDEYGVPREVATQIYRTMGRAGDLLCVPTPSGNSGDDNGNSGGKGVNRDSLFERLFWSLELGDVLAATSRYSEETMRLKTILSGGTQVSSGVDTTELVRLKRDRDRAPTTILALEAESRTAEERVQKGHQLVLQTPDHADIENIQADDLTLYNNEWIFWKCILPRSIQTPGEAIFVAHFLQTFLRRTPPNMVKPFPFWDIIGGMMVGKMGQVMSMLTEWEAHNYSRFVRIILSEVKRWAEDEALWNDQMQSLPSLMMETDSAKREVDEGGADEDQANKDELAMMEEEGAATITKTRMEVEESESTVQRLAIKQRQVLSHKEFKQQWYKWHLKLHRAFLAILDTNGLTNKMTSSSSSSSSLSPLPMDYYLPIRNSLIVLTRLTGAGLFPVVKGMGQSLLRAVTRLREHEGQLGREDLKVMATRYGAVLRASLCDSTTTLGSVNVMESMSEGFFDEGVEGIKEQGELSNTINHEPSYMGTTTTTITTTATTFSSSSSRKRAHPSTAMEIDSFHINNIPGDENGDGISSEGKRSRRESPRPSQEHSPKPRDRDREKDREVERERTSERDRGRDRESNRNRDAERQRDQYYQSGPLREYQTREQPQQQQRDREKELRERIKVERARAFEEQGSEQEVRRQSDRIIRDAEARERRVISRPTPTSPTHSSSSSMRNREERSGGDYDRRTSSMRDRDQWERGDSRRHGDEEVSTNENDGMVGSRSTERRDHRNDRYAAPRGAGTRDIPSSTSSYERRSTSRRHN